MRILDPTKTIFSFFVHSFALTMGNVTPCCAGTGEEINSDGQTSNALSDGITEIPKIQRIASAPVNVPDQVGP